MKIRPKISFRLTKKSWLQCPRESSELAKLASLCGLFCETRFDNLTVIIQSIVLFDGNLQHSVSLNPFVVSKRKRKGLSFEVKVALLTHIAYPRRTFSCFSTLIAGTMSNLLQHSHKLQSQKVAVKPL